MWSCWSAGVPSQENTEREEFDMRDGKRRNPTLLQSGLGFERGSRGSGSSARCDAVVTIDTKTDPTDIPEPDLGPGEFLIDVHKDEDGAGLEIESISGMLLVAKLKRGPMIAWNAEHAHEPHLMVKAGDRIVGVNGVESDSSRLIDELKRGTRLRLVMRHPREFKVCLEKNGRELGMCVIGGNVKLDMLKISALRAGVVEDWNRSHSSAAIASGDRIISVNGIDNEPAKMLDELRANDVLHVTVIRPS